MEYPSNGYIPKRFRNMPFGKTESGWAMNFPTPPPINNRRVKVRKDRSIVDRSTNPHTPCKRFINTSYWLYAWLQQALHRNYTALVIARWLLAIRHYTFDHMEMWFLFLVEDTKLDVEGGRPRRRSRPMRSTTLSQQSGLQLTMMTLHSPHTDRDPAETL